jgi:hypothetical protein
MFRRILALTPVLLWAAYGFQARTYGIGSVNMPGPGAFPFGLALVGMALSLVVVVAGRGPAATTSPARQPLKIDRETILVALMLGCLPATSLFGVLPVIFVFTAAAARLMGIRTWWAALVVAAGLTLVVHLLFAVWLGVPLPKGSLFR